MGDDDFPPPRGVARVTLNGSHEHGDQTMTDTTPDDLTTDELYRLLNENPDTEVFTPQDLEEVRDADDDVVDDATFEFGGAFDVPTAVDPDTGTYRVPDHAADLIEKTKGADDAADVADVLNESPAHEVALIINMHDLPLVADAD